ncbi:MAG: glycosyltransferase family 39 protein, partial [Deltaproteobacteria bacterium]|nr:glycosyltransferase family 39 protein [Deltaproteobacteria bacterium]
MPRASQLFAKMRAPIGVALLAIALILVGLGGFGLWEPHEVAVVAHLDKHAPASAAIRGGQAAVKDRLQADKPDDKNKASEPKRPDQLDKAERQPCPDDEIKPSLGTELIARSYLGSNNDFGGRLPNAMCGLLIIGLCWLFGRQAQSRRAGLLSALVALTFPAVILGSRSLTGDMLTMLSQTVVLTSALVVLWPPEGKIWIRLLASVGVGLGLVVGYRSSGMLLGVIAPASAIAVAGLGFSSGALSALRKNRELPAERVRVAGLTVVFAVVALGATAIFVREVFDLVAAGADDRKLFGMTLAPCLGKTQAALGNWRPDGDLETNFQA